MIVRRYITAGTVALSFTLALSGGAFAENVAIDTTGADSNQSVVINNTSDYSVVNVNNVMTTNTSSQAASTGSVSADKNTSVGGATGSGDAVNTNGTATTVGIGNATPVPVVAEANTGGTGVAAPAAAATPSNGGVLGAATTAGGMGAGAAMLPVTGPSVPVDVSALRAAWGNQTAAPAVTLAKTSNMFTGAMLLTATVLSIIGALGSAWYARRREERV